MTADEYREEHHSERDLQAALIEWAEMQPGENGAPLYIELKHADNTLTEAQEDMIEQLRDAGNRVRVCRRLDDAIEAIREHL